MIESISLRNFRNHRDETYTLSEKTFIEGPNGSGKTSLLEAIYFTSLLKSHRTSDDQSMIMYHKPSARITVKTNKNLYDIVIQPDRKHLSVDKVPIKKMSQFIGGYKVVIFSPEDLDLVKGMPKIRRQFLDIEMFQINPNYMASLTTYKEVLNQRNGLLKRIKPNDDLTFLHILTKRLIEEASLIIDERERFITALNQAFKTHFKRLNERDEVEVIYEPNTLKNALEETLFSRLEKDILTKITNQGPHRDDFKILFNQNPAKEYASQGQQRLIVIALKLAIIDLINSKEVIVLLDDILSELDEDIQLKIASLFELGTQTIITGTKNIFNIQSIKLKEGKRYGEQL